VDDHWFIYITKLKKKKKKKKKHYIKKLKIFPKKIYSEKLEKWRSIGYDVVGHTLNGKEKKVPKVCYHDIPPRKLVSYLKLSLQFVVTHNFVSKCGKNAILRS
jgi:hypothetical protein